MNQDPSHQETSHEHLTASQVNDQREQDRIWRLRRELAERPSMIQVEVTCPICLNSFHHADSPVEWHRVNNALCNPDGVNPRASLLQAAHWLRAGAPGRALATIEAALSKGGACA